MSHTYRKAIPIPRRADIKFSHDGRIHISARIVRILGLRKGKSINIATQDRECYLFAEDITIGRPQVHTYPTYTPRGSAPGGTWRASSVRLARKVMALAGISHGIVSLLCGEPMQIQGKTHIPLITKNPL